MRQQTRKKRTSSLVSRTTRALGLLIFAGACYVIFYTVWFYAYYFNNIYVDFARIAVPPIVGGVLFITVGLYMMLCGRKAAGSPVEIKPV